jgi:uncharacterized alkaline shock family protein YloU
MVLHCVADFDSNLAVKKVIITEDLVSYGIDVLLSVPFKMQLSGSIHNLQTYIVDNIERYTGLVLDEVNVTIDTVQ